MFTLSIQVRLRNWQRACFRRVSISVQSYSIVVKKTSQRLTRSYTTTNLRHVTVQSKYLLSYNNKCTRRNGVRFLIKKLICFRKYFEYCTCVTYMHFATNYRCLWLCSLNEHIYTPSFSKCQCLRTKPS